MINSDVILIGSAIVVAIVIVITVARVIAGKGSTSKVLKALEGFSGIVIELIEKGMESISGSDYSTLDDYLKVVVPNVSEELKRIVDKSALIDDAIKKLITEDLIETFIRNVIELNRTDLEDTFNRIKKK